MLSVREEPGYLVITASGRLTREDYDRFVPEFERIVGDREEVPILVDATAFEGWDIQGLWEELRFDIRHRATFGRLAILGDARWQDWGTRFSAPFFRAEMRYFPAAEADAARRWLAGKS